MHLGFEVNTSPVCGYLERFVFFFGGNISDSFLLENGDANNVIVKKNRRRASITIFWLIWW